MMLGSHSWEKDSTQELGVMRRDSARPQVSKETVPELNEKPKDDGTGLKSKPPFEMDCTNFGRLYGYACKTYHIHVQEGFGFLTVSFYVAHLQSLIQSCESCSTVV